MATTITDITKYAAGGGISIFALFALVLNMTGVSFSHDGDKACIDCYSEILVKSTYYEYKVENAGSKPVVFKKSPTSRTIWINLDKINEFVITAPPIPVEILIYVNGTLRPIKSGDTLIAKNTKTKPNPSKIILHAVKNPEEKVKWSMIADTYLSEAIDIDPIWGSLEMTQYLNGINDSREYEYPYSLANGSVIPTVVNITTFVNITDLKTCITIDDIVNVSCGFNNWSYYFNVTHLEINKFLNGSRKLNISAGIENVSLRLDNRTDIVFITLNFTGYDYSGYPTNLEIDTDRDGRSDHVFPGEMRGQLETVKNFSSSVGYGGSVFTTFSSTFAISVNASADGVPHNFSLKLSGLAEDQGNNFTHSEKFTETETMQNASLSYNTSAPLGIFDNFQTNSSGRWQYTGSTGLLQYTTSGDCPGYNGEINCLIHHTNAGQAYLTYNDEAADMRNTSYILAFVKYDISVQSCSNNCGSGTAAYYVYATDGTNRVELYSDSINGNGIGGQQQQTSVYNLTFKVQNEAGTSWQVVRNGSGISTKDLSSLDPAQQWKIEFSPYASDGTNRDATTYGFLEDLQWGGAWLNYHRVNSTYAQYGNFTSSCVKVTPRNLTRVTLQAYSYNPTNTDLNYYVSSNCNDTQPVFESVQNGVSHVFSGIGNYISYRVELNSSVNITSPVIRKVIVSAVEGNLTNVSVDFGADGVTDWNYEGVIDATNSPKNVNGSMDGFTGYYSSNCLGKKVCLYPVSFSASRGGILNITGLNFTVSIKDIQINKTPLETRTILNFSYMFQQGILEIGAIVANFKGSYNFTINSSNAINASVNIQGRDSHLAMFKYSEMVCNYTAGISRFQPQVNVRNLNQSNITIFGQRFSRCNTSVNDYCVHTSKPLFNCTMFGYDDNASLFMYVNMTSINPRVNHSFDTGVNRTTPMQVKGENLTLITSNLQEYQSKGIFAFMDFYNMTLSSLQAIDFNYDFKFRTYCEGCVR